MFRFLYGHLQNKQLSNMDSLLEVPKRPEFISTLHVGINSTKGIEESQQQSEDI